MLIIHRDTPQFPAPDFLRQHGLHRVQIGGVVHVAVAVDLVRRGGKFKFAAALRHADLALGADGPLFLPRDGNAPALAVNEAAAVHVHDDPGAQAADDDLSGGVFDLIAAGVDGQAALPGPGADFDLLAGLGHTLNVNSQLHQHPGAVFLRQGVHAAAPPVRVVSGNVLHDPQKLGGVTALSKYKLSFQSFHFFLLR